MRNKKNERDGPPGEGEEGDVIGTFKIQKTTRDGLTYLGTPGPVTMADEWAAAVLQSARYLFDHVE